MLLNCGVGKDSWESLGQQGDSVQFSSVAQLCPTLCDPMDWSTPGLPVHHRLLEFTQTHVHWSVMPSNHLILSHPFSFCLQSFPASGSFPMSQFFASGGQSIGVSASASLLPMNTQDWFPWGLTGLLDLTKEAKDVYHKNYITPTQGITEDTDVVCSCSGRLTMVKALSLSITWVDNIRG